MPRSLQHRSVFNTKLGKLVDDMSAWEGKERIDEEEVVRIRQAITPFTHTPSFSEPYQIGSVVVIQDAFAVRSIGARHKRVARINAVIGFGQEKLCRRRHYAEDLVLTKFT